VKITLLGTGTSQGVPVIGCQCAVCTSPDPRDNRLRSSALISDGTVNILIDPGPDFRQQMLRAQVQRLDAIIITHEHNDHVIGIDDVRPFNFVTGQPIRMYALARVASELRRRFEYVFGDPIPGLPRIELLTIDQDSIVQVAGIEIQAIGIMHGTLPILGFRISDLTYLTDVKTIRPSERLKIAGTRFLVVNALQHLPHPTHLNLEECLALWEQLRPEQTWLTHISHYLGLTSDIEQILPDSVSLGYDGLSIEW